MNKDVRNESHLKTAASAESIGSCSLDVDYTTSESNAALLTSRLGFKPSPSQRTLHSFDSQRLLAQSSEEISSVSSSQYNDRRQTKLNNTRDVFKSEDSVFNYRQPRKPSYVNISCSVSGYTPAINYHCLKFGLSSLQSLTKEPLILSKRKPRSFTEMMNGTNSKSDFVDCAPGNFYKKSPDSFCSQFTKTNSIFNNNNKMTSVETSTVYTSSLRTENTNGTNGAEANTEKSFIQQRVERLYGRGAFAPSFYKQKSTSPRSSLSPSQDCKTTNQEKTAPISPTKIPELPVLKLLRPEFRDQLTISSSHSTPWWKQQLRPVPKPATNGTSSSQERIIPITLEADVISHKSKMDKEENGKVCDVATQAQEVSQDLQPAADEVIPIISAVSPGSSASHEKDAHHFLKLHSAESLRLLKLADEYEAELDKNADTLTEDMKGKLHAAFGKARLLVRQKLKQFEGLCHRNLACNTDEPFPTTVDDLAGFWDMVYLQVGHVDCLFDELNELRNKGWPAESTPKKVPAPRQVKTAAKMSNRGVKSAPANPKLSEKAQEAARLREEQRKKILEERRRLAKLQKKLDDTVEIFAPVAE